MGWVKYATKGPWSVKAEDLSTVTVKPGLSLYISASTLSRSHVPISLDIEGFMTLVEATPQSFIVENN
jgi:hypothetical protein